MTGHFLQKEVILLNDKETITAIRERDETVIGEVITKYSRLLWSVAGAVLDKAGSSQDVEECVADTFIYLWEHPDAYDPLRGKLKTWLTIVARTRAVDRYREIARRDTVPLEDTELMDQLGIMDQILRQETKGMLLAAINALGEPEREILVRRYYYDQKPKEISRVMRMSVKQVDNCLYQTKQKLRGTLSLESL